MASEDCATIFAERFVPDVMQAILNRAPMSPRKFQEQLCIGLISGQRGHVIHGLGLFFTVDGSFADQAADLLDTGPIQIVRQSFSAGDRPTLQATVPFVTTGGGLTLSLPFALCVGGKRPRLERRIPERCHVSIEADCP